MADDLVDVMDKPAAAGADAAPAAAAGGGADTAQGAPDAKPDAATAAQRDGKSGTDTAGKAPADPKAARAAASEPEAKGKATDKKSDATDDDGLGFDEDADGEAKGPATWPDDWREKLAGGDEKFLKELGRFASPDTFAKSYRALRSKLSSGEFKRALPEDASDEEKAAWRAENGIPDKPEGYEFPTIKGHEWSDADKEMAGSFLSELHAANAPKPIAQAALAWYAKFQQQQAEQIANIDRVALEAREDTLRADYGRDYRAQIRLATDTFKDDDVVHPELRSMLANARTPDGRRVIHHPEFTRFFAQLGMERRGPGALITGEQGARMASRMDEIKKIMSTDLDRYYAEGLDKEYLDLQEKQSSGRSR